MRKGILSFVVMYDYGVFNIHWAKIYMHNRIEEEHIYKKTKMEIKKYFFGQGSQLE